jgi:N-acyl-D-aspartate/D-glutamate deacylase
MFPVSPPYWGQLARKATDLVEEARARGTEVTFDITVWPRGGGPFAQHLPGWAQEGGTSALKERLADPVTRAEIAQQMETGAPDWQGWFRPVWGDFVICKSGLPQHSAWVGRTITDLAAERGMPPAEMALVLLLEDDGQYWTAPTTKSQEDMNYLLSHPLGIAVVDRPAVAPYGPLGHPTSLGTYGTFPRVLGRYAREWGTLSMEVAVQKITSIPAQRMGIADRGVLRPGLHADITVFDPETIIDRETFQDSHTFPDGIEYVIVNGELVVEGNAQHDARPGKVL